MTARLQPLDIAVNRSFKAQVRCMFQREFEKVIGEERGRTALERNLNWFTRVVRQAWRGVHAKIIRKGFEKSMQFESTC